MSLKKDHIQSSGGLRVAADDPHLVSLGNGRLSTAVTIHPIHIGEFDHSNILKSIISILSSFGVNK